jgi:CBS domain-containing protein
MKVSEILKVKGNTLYTITPSHQLTEAIAIMAEHDVGSLCVMEHGDLVGMITFREVLLVLNQQDGTTGQRIVRNVMDDHPITCTPETLVNDVRRMMLAKHTRYLPVLNARVLMGVISFYDVARAVLEAQSFENTLLKAYIKDWPSEKDE